MRSWILVVEDEPVLGEMICDNLTLDGHGAELCGDGVAALERIRRGGIDLVILDVMLPRRDGFAVLRDLRQEHNQVPVLILSARNRDEDRILGLELQADDYLVKPFHLKELLLRVGALLRRRGTVGREQDELQVGAIRIDFRRLQLARADGSVDALKDTEARLLKLLAGRGGAVVDRRELLGSLFGSDSVPTARTLDNLIMRLRRLLDDDPRAPRFLHTVRGVGYRLTVAPGDS
jgi:two-component system alkaline phosphatase synthesis response regulator PhoP